MPDFPARALIDWFSLNQRALPWRRDYDPYHVWVSEVMAQQTRMDQMLPYFARFLEAFPSIQSLADADAQAVLKRWEGLGYYSRARNLHAAAKQVVEKHGGKLPTTKKELLSLKGVGPYIASAVASIAFQENVPLVDGNVLRVATRFWGISEDVSKPSTRKTIEEKLAGVLPKGRAREFNQGLMELGALVCSPTRPACESCPLRAACHAFRTRTQDRFPVKTRRGKVPVKHFAMILIRDGKDVGLVQRTSNLLQGMWEFPSVEFAPLQDSPRDIERAFAREGFPVRLGKNRGVFSHAYSHFTQHVHVFESTPKNTLVSVTWVPSSSVRGKPLSKIQTKVLDALDSA